MTIVDELVKQTNFTFKQEINLWYITKYRTPLLNDQYPQGNKNKFSTVTTT